MPKFSLIIPCYNLAPWIRACLDSVRAQDCPDWEAICVDDESSDASGAILDEYAGKDARIQVIHQKNAGEGGARNTGLAQAAGQWVFFLDGDDVLAPGSLSVLSSLVKAHPAEKLFRFDYQVFEDGQPWTPRQPDLTCRRKEISRAIPMRDFFTYVWQHLFHRSIVENRRFKRYKRGCDRVFIDDILLNAVDSFVETNAILYGYRQRQTSVMHRPPSLQIIRDEMDHRRDIVNMIEASPKHVAYAGNWWLEGYFTADVGALAAGRPAAEKRAIREHWQMCAREMRKAKGFSRRARWVFAVCTRFPSPFVWWLFCRDWPRISPYRFCRRVAGRFVREVRKIAFERKQK